MLNPWKDRGSKAGPDTEDEDVADDPTAGPEADESRDGDDPDGDRGSGERAVERTGDAGPEPLEAELADLKDRHLRLAAEFENFRKRTRKEASVGRTLAQAELVRAILPTVDDLARVADTPHESTTVEALDEGIELILKNLRKQLAEAGLERIEALDERFDPERHQAVMTADTDDPELDDTVSRVLVDGYEFLGRLVRPAQVEVRRFEEPGDDAVDG